MGMHVREAGQSSGGMWKLAVGRGLSWINAPSRSPGAAIRLGYFRFEQKRLRRQEQLVTKFPFVRGRKAPSSTRQRPPALPRSHST